MLSKQKISSDFFNVNDLSEDIHHNRKLILGDILREVVLSHQETLLNQDLGHRYRRGRIEASFSCPQCDSRHFTRKGKRERVYRCVIGKVKVYLLQVKCSQCGHRFCPPYGGFDWVIVCRPNQRWIDRKTDRPYLPDFLQ